jgi:hypothetical protein
MCDLISKPGENVPCKLRSHLSSLGKASLALSPDILDWLLSSLILPAACYQDFQRSTSKTLTNFDTLLYPPLIWQCLQDAPAPNAVTGLAASHYITLDALSNGGVACAVGLL